jgi:hypothetical protein
MVTRHGEARAAGRCKRLSDGGGGRGGYWQDPGRRRDQHTPDQQAARQRRQQKRRLHDSLSPWNSASEIGEQPCLILDGFDGRSVDVDF